MRKTVSDRGTSAASSATLTSLLDFLDDTQEGGDILAGDGQDSLRARQPHAGDTDGHLCSRVIDRIVTRWLEQEGRPSNRDDWEMMVYCLLSGKTLRDVIERTARFQQITRISGGKIEWTERGAVAEIRMSSQSRVRGRMTLAVETIALTNFHALFGWLIGQPLPILDLVYGFPARFERYALKGLLPAVGRFDAGPSRFRFPSRFLDYRVASHVEDVDEILSRRLLAGFDTDSGQGSVVAQVKRAISNTLLVSHIVSPLSEVCATLGYSQTTLRRRLADSDTSYSQIKDHCRQEIAQHLLTNTDLNIEEVSDQLGFCDSDAFRMAFRSWTGKCPTRFRQIHRTAGLEPGDGPNLH
jgi:AraC-like DNA-binding protein